VGKILGFFETLSSSKKEPEPLEADTTKVPLLSLDHSAVSFSQSQPQTFVPVVDDRMASYLQMTPEASIGSDPATGK
jgi:hypothetical protein